MGGKCGVPKKEREGRGVVEVGRGRLRGLVLGGGRHLTLGTGSREPGREVASHVAPTLSNLSQEASKSISRGLKHFIIAKQNFPQQSQYQPPSNFEIVM